jgi:type I restriction enzyme M protein
VQIGASPADAVGTAYRAPPLAVPSACAGADWPPRFLSELTYLLFLKIAEETGREDLLPDGCRWTDLTAHPNGGVLGYYRKMLPILGEVSPDHVVREIFRFPTTVFNHEENLRQVVDGINAIYWHEAKSDGLGAVYESLLQRSVAEAR